MRRDCVDGGTAPGGVGEYNPRPPGPLSHCRKRETAPQRQGGLVLAVVTSYTAYDLSAGLQRLLSPICTQTRPDLHQNPAKVVLPNTAADTPEAISPGVLLD